MGRGHAATSSLIPTGSGTAWVICGGSEGAAARCREGQEGRLSARSQEQLEGGRAALYLREPWGRRRGGTRCGCAAPTEGGRYGGAASACVKQGRGRDAVALPACVEEIRCVKMGCLRRDKGTLMGCLLSWANHSLYICPFLVFLFPFFSFSCLFPAAIILFLRLVRRRLALPRRRLVYLNEWIAGSRLVTL